MLGSSITLTVNAIAKAMQLINQDAYSAEYALFESTEKWVLKVSHRRDKANKDGVVYARHVVDFTQTTYAVAGVSPELQKRYYATFVCRDGDSVEENYLVAALSAYLTASSGANAIKILNWES